MMVSVNLVNVKDLATVLIIPPPKANHFYHQDSTRLMYIVLYSSLFCDKA